MTAAQLNLLDAPIQRPAALTMEQARADLLRRAKDGANCPCCGRLAKIYRRKLNKTMGAAVAWLVRQQRTPEDWIDVPKRAPRWVIRTNQLGTVAHWGLLEQATEADGKKRTSGIWRPTNLGRSFVLGKVTVPAWVELLNNEVEAWATEQVSITDVVGVDFDFSELMEGDS
jgi:hypothetical protein